MNSLRANFLSQQPLFTTCGRVSYLLWWWFRAADLCPLAPWKSRWKHQISANVEEKFKHGLPNHPPHCNIYLLLVLRFASESDFRSKWLLTPSSIYHVPALDNTQGFFLQLSCSHSLHLMLPPLPPPSGLMPRRLGGLPPCNLLTRCFSERAVNVTPILCLT